MAKINKRGPDCLIPIYLQRMVRNKRISNKEICMLFEGYSQNIEHRYNEKNGATKWKKLEPQILRVLSFIMKNRPSLAKRGKVYNITWMVYAEKYITQKSKK